MKSFRVYEFPGKDGLTKEFYVTCWDDIKATFNFFRKTNKGKEGVKYFSKPGNN